MKGFRDILFFTVITLLTTALTVMFICAVFSPDAADDTSRIWAGMIAVAIPAAYTFGVITYFKKPRHVHAKVTNKNLTHMHGHVARRGLYYNFTLKAVELCENGRLKEYNCDDETYYDLKEGESYDLLIKGNTILGIDGRDAQEEDGYDEDIDKEYDFIYPDGRKG